MSSPVPPPVDPSVGCLALVQVVGASALRSRVPAAFARGEALLESAALHAARASGGHLSPSVARGWTYRFEEAADAVRFAFRLQLEALALDWPATLLVRPEAAEERARDGHLLYRGLRMRIAIHHGRVSTAPDAGVGGPAVYQVARTAAAAHAGQILVTEVGWERVRGALPGSPVVRDLGPHVLTGVDGETRLLQVLPEALDARSFPEPATQRVRRTNVPASDEGGFGRQGDLTALSELVGLGVRSVAVVGPYGVGKSRLVRHFARARAADGRFAGGVWLCRVDASTVGSLCRATAWALQVPLDGGATATAAVEQLGFAIASRGALLLVIDGMDPTPEVAAAIDGWLRTAPKLTCVVNTARHLRTRGEVVYEVRPLAVRGRGTRHDEAVRIYTTHARGVDEDFTVDDPAMVAEIVQRVEGLPLAIRLLAGVVDRLPPDQQLERLRAGQLHPGNLLDPVLDLLDPDEWRVLVACSALPGSFDVRALDDAGADSPRLVERLERRGLLRAHPDLGAPQVHRYAVEVAVRRLVLGRLPEEERQALRERRATALVRACEPLAARAELRDRTETVAQLAVEWDGLVDAIGVGLDPTREDPEAVELALRACLALRPVIEARGPLFVGLELLDLVLRRCDAILGSDPLLQLRVLVMRASELRRAGRVTAALADLDRASAIARRWSDLDGASLCHVELGRSLFDNGASDSAVAELERAVQIASEAGDDVRHAIAAAVLGPVYMGVGRYDDAETQLQHAVSLLRLHGVLFMEARTLGWLALVHRRKGRYDDACSLYQESIRSLRQLGAPGLESRARADLGLIDIHLDHQREAEDALIEAVNLARWIGDRRAESNALRHLGLLGVLRGDLDRARERLFEALAIDRDRGDRVQEGIDTGFVGLAHHLDDHPEPARESYRRAIQMLEETGEGRMLTLFSGWQAALDAERLDPMSARTLFEAALLKHAEIADPQVGEALLQLRGSLDLMEATLADDQGDVAAAARWRRTAHDRWDEASARRSPLPVEARLAHARLGRRLSPNRD